MGPDMWLKILLSIFLAIILIINAIHSFLPTHLLEIKFVKYIGILAALIILVYGVIDIVGNVKSYTYAYVNENAEIIRKNNFPWSITKTSSEDSKTIYIINERFGDASSVKVIPDSPIEHKVYNAFDGVAIKFNSSSQIPSFKIEILK